MSAASAVEWSFRPVLRPVHLAGRTLFRVPVPLYVCESHFSALPDDPDALPLPLDDDPVARGAYVRSQPVRQDLPRFGTRRGLMRYVPQHYDRTLVRKRGSFADYLGKFGSKERNTIKRKVRKYTDAAGEDFLRTFRTVDDVAPFLALAQILVPRTYQDRLYGNQLHDTPEWRQFLEQKASHDRFRGFVAMKGDQPTAFWQFTRLGAVLLSEYTGYDPEAHALSPGVVLLYGVLESMFADPQLAALDFGEGEAQYKEHFGTDRQRCAEIFYLRPSLRNAELIAVDQVSWLAHAAFAPLDRQLDRRGWRAPLKRFLRRVS